MNLPAEFGVVSQSSRFVHQVRTDAAQLGIDADLQARQKQLEQERERALNTAEKATAAAKLACLKDLILEAYVAPLQKSGLPLDMAVSPVEPINESHRFSDDPLKDFSREGNYKMTLNLKGAEGKAPFEIVIACRTRGAENGGLSVNLWPGTQERKRREDYDSRREEDIPFVRTGERQIILANAMDVDALNAPLVAMLPGWLHSLSKTDATLRQNLRASSPHPQLS